MKKFIAILILAMACSTEADAQAFLKKLGEKALSKAKEKVEKKIEKVVGHEEDNKADDKEVTISTAKLKKSAKSDSSENPSEAGILGSLFGGMMKSAALSEEQIKQMEGPLGALAGMDLTKLAEGKIDAEAMGALMQLQDSTILRQMNAVAYIMPTPMEMLQAMENAGIDFETATDEDITKAVAPVVAKKWGISTSEVRKIFAMAKSDNPEQLEAYMKKNHPDLYRKLSQLNTGSNLK